MQEKKNPKESLITELAFNLILDSEESEGFGLDIKSVDTKGAKSIQHINRETILDFLRDEYTKVCVKTEMIDEDYEISYLRAHNNISNETIKIRGLQDNYLALIDAVYQGNEKWKQLKENPNATLLTHDFIKHINVTHQKRRQEDAGIANYRKWQGTSEEWRKLYGYIPHEVHLNSYDKDGRYTRVTSLNLAKSKDVERLMDELIDWVNNTAFRNGRDIYHDIAEFHARFIKIHPFGDGNGRTARLLTNYLLIALGQSMVTIPIDEKEEYCLALDYANSEDLDLSSREIEHFSDYLCRKYSLESEPSSFKYLESERTPENKYDDLAKFLKNHQLPQSAKNCVKQILNNYAMKNIGERISIGRLKAEFEPDTNN